MLKATGFRFVFWSIVLGLFVSGSLAWFFKNWYLVDQGFGLGPRSIQVYFLKTHGTTALLFLVLLGFVIASHVQPRLQKKYRRWSGLLFLSGCTLSILTVPFLLYLSDEYLHSIAAKAHAWVGLSLSIPFAVHLRSAKKYHFKKYV